MSTEELCIILKQKLPNFQHSFVMSQIRNADRHPKGRRWMFMDKSFALNVLYQSPATYRIMGKFLCLPSKSSLCSYVGNSEFEVGFGTTVLSKLEKKINFLDEVDKVCTIVLDEMSIKPNYQYNSRLDIVEGVEDLGEGPGLGHRNVLAHHALVIMVQGLRTKWEQPVAYFFSNTSVPPKKFKLITIQTIEMLQNIGLEILGLICDMAGTNIGLFKELNVSEECPYFTVNGKHITAIYDPPHLLKSTRNNVEKYGVTIETCRVEWSNIEKKYDLDNQSSIPDFVKTAHILPKLTKSHIHPNNKDKMKVRYAAQIFSNSVAAP